jgi:hypothetical protein
MRIDDFGRLERGMQQLPKPLKIFKASLVPSMGLRGVWLSLLILWMLLYHI